MDTKLAMPDEQIKKWVAFNLSLILEAGEDKLLSYIGPDDINIFRNKFFILGDNILARRARLLIQGILQGVPTRRKWLITTFLKKTRAIFFRRLARPSLCSGTRAILDISKRARVPFRGWSGKKWVICLTHDVDTPQCYEFISSLTDMEKGYGVKSAFYFLTEGEYTLDAGFLSSLEQDGFETALHGATHDIALAYRSDNEMVDTILGALERGGFGHCGFRSPSLSISSRLLETLRRCKMSYDSSVPLDHRGWGSCFPYMFPEAQLWELPICLQDDVLFRELNLSEDQALAFSKRLIEDVRKVGGVGVLSFHPVLMKEKSGFYEKLLSYLKEQKDLWIAKPHEIVNLMEQRRRGKGG